jgi:hypothetical protein
MRTDYVLINALGKLHFLGTPGVPSRSFDPMKFLCKELAAQRLNKKEIKVTNKDFSLLVSNYIPCACMFSKARQSKKQGKG